MKKILSITIGLLLLTPMAFAELTKEVSIDKIEVLKNGNIQVRKRLTVYEDGVYLSHKFIDRQIFTPDTTIEGIDMGEGTDRIKNIATVVWTQEVVEAYEIKKAERRAKEIE